MMNASSPYGSTIGEHFRRPRNYGPLAGANATAEGTNPLCGDRVRLAIAVDDRQRSITDARFVANACAICVASASLLTERVRGQSVSTAAALEDADVLSALASDIPAARRRCATLPLEALRRALAALPSASGGTGQ